MGNTFTQDLLVKYIYGEANLFEQMEIEQALEQDWELKELFDLLTQNKQELPKVEFSPSRQTIQNILKYSSETALEEKV